MNIEQYHHGHLCEALINGAFQQIRQGGATALNLSKLAKTIGVSQPAIYRHFPNKQALAISVAQRRLEQLTEALQKKTQNTENDAFKGIQAITKACVKFALNNPKITRLMNYQNILKQQQERYALGCLSCKHYYRERKPAIFYAQYFHIYKQRNT